MPSSTEICNLALGHLGIGQTIASLTERSNEARACNRVYAIARDLVLEDFPWPFAKKQVALALLQEFTGETDEWQFAYQYPSDAMAVIRLLNPVVRNESRDQRVPYKIFYGTAGREIRTDLEDALVEYTFKVTDEGRFTPSFTIALSYKIAELIAAELTGGDPFKKGADAANNYTRQILKAQAISVNEEQPEKEPESELVRSREES